MIADRQTHKHTDTLITILRSRIALSYLINAIHSTLFIYKFLKFTFWKGAIPIAVPTELPLKTRENPVLAGRHNFGTFVALSH